MQPGAAFGPPFPPYVLPAEGEAFLLIGVLPLRRSVTFWLIVLDESFRPRFAHAVP